MPYLPIGDYGVIGDLHTVALVSMDGSIDFLCYPHFESPSVFAALLDDEKGGRFRISPMCDGLTRKQQMYWPETNVLVTRFLSPEGVGEITDFMPVGEQDAGGGYHQIIRRVRVVRGSLPFEVTCSPAFNYARDPHETEITGAGATFRSPDMGVALGTRVPLRAEGGGVRAEFTLDEGQTAVFVLRQVEPDAGSGECLSAEGAERLFRATVGYWRGWLAQCTYTGRWREQVHRSALALKLLTCADSGAIVAAPTFGLPEVIGGERNWDYRYAWIRDAAFSVYALRRIGMASEAAGFLGWVLDAVERHGRPKVLYDLDGEIPDPEREDPELEGYRRSAPVRWGNAADGQRQHDVFGEILDCAYQWASDRWAGAPQMDEELWGRLRGLADDARREWREPDHGIWEVRTAGRPFTYSAALCGVALDRAARLAGRLALPGDAKGWRAEAAEIRRAVLEQAWDPEQRALTAHLGGGGLDASVLALPLRRVVPADHPKMVATAEAVTRRLGAGDGLLYRYLPDESPDGLSGHEGAFVLCSFWLVDNLAGQGRLEEAHELYGALCDRANPLGLLPEQIDPTDGAFLGNYPQAFSHIGVISSGFNLARATEKGAQTS